MVKAVTLTFCRIQKILIRDIRAKFDIPNSSQFPYIVQNSNEDISDIWISGKSLIKKNCPNSRTSNDIYMRLEPVTKPDERKMECRKKSWPI